MFDFLISASIVIVIIVMLLASSVYIVKQWRKQLSYGSEK